MFSQNEGTTDRVLRIVVGLALLIAFFLLPEASYRWVLLIGLVPLVTGIIGTCPIYSALGLSTCPHKS